MERREQLLCEITQLIGDLNKRDEDSYHALARLNTEDTLFFARDTIVTIRTNNGYRKTPRTKDDSLFFTGQIYKGKRDGWIVKFTIKPDESLSVDGSQILAIEIPLHKIIDDLTLKGTTKVLNWIEQELTPTSKSMVNQEKRANDYRHDERFGAWA